jgi:hypothetical protein
MINFDLDGAGVIRDIPPNESNVPGWADVRMRSRRSPVKRRMLVYIGYPRALEAATLIDPSGLVFGTDISLPCADTSFDAVTCLVGLMCF